MSIKILPDALSQNPAPVTEAAGGQGRFTKRLELADKIVGVLLQTLPSNYVSQVKGPSYTIWLQAMAERLAEVQIEAQEAFADSAFDATRSEFLFQFLGHLVFPDAGLQGGLPAIQGDVSLRTLLAKMVVLLLQGAKLDTLGDGLRLLTDADISLVERAIASRDTAVGSSWTLDDQFTIEANVSGANGTQFPNDPFVLQRNVEIIARALKPAHALLQWRHLFLETFQVIKAESMTWSMRLWKREDVRKNWLGALNVSGTQGTTLIDKRLFSDASRDFSQVQPGSDLVIQSGPNSIATSSIDEGWVGRFRVLEVLTFPVSQNDATPRTYTTTPSGLTGSVLLIDGTFIDTEQDWSLAIDGEVLTMPEGPNAGSYRLDTIRGNDGGSIGSVALSDQETSERTRVIPSSSILRLDRAMASAATGQSYTVTIDRKGTLVPRAVVAEDVTSQFWT